MGLPNFSLQRSRLHRPAELERSAAQPLGTQAAEDPFLALGQTPALAATINVDGTSWSTPSPRPIPTPPRAVVRRGARPTPWCFRPAAPTADRGDSTDDGPTGLPAIASVITIEGNGSRIRRDRIAAEFRILAVRFNGNLTLKGATVSGGLVANFSGGGVHNRGTVSMLDSTVSGNSAGFAGGLYNSGAGASLTLTQARAPRN